MNIPSIERLEKVYGESVKSAERLSVLAKNFRKSMVMMWQSFFCTWQDRNYWQSYRPQRRQGDCGKY